MSNIYKQSGENNKYPRKIKTWTFGEEIPEWISDFAKIGFIDGEGNLTLEVIETNEGGFEILRSDGQGILVKVKNKKDPVCISLGEEYNTSETIKTIFSLTKHQLDLLYEPENLPSKKA